MEAFSRSSFRFITLDKIFPGPAFDYSLCRTSRSTLESSDGRDNLFELLDILTGLALVFGTRIPFTQTQIFVFSQIVVSQQLQMIGRSKPQFIPYEPRGCLDIFRAVIKTGDQRCPELNTLVLPDQVLGIFQDMLVGYPGTLLMSYVVHTFEVIQYIICVIGNHFDGFPRECA